MPQPTRRALLALPALALLAACQAAPTSVPGAALGASLTSIPAERVPLQTPLALRYGAATAGHASLYTIGSSGTVVRLFENRAVTAGTLQDFPRRTEPVMRFGPPAGTEQFVLIVTSQPFNWLAPTDYADATPYARLTLNAATFEARLASALATLPPGTHQVQRLSLTTF